MPDSKSNYSAQSRAFVERALANEEDKARTYKRSKTREARHNERWKTQSVNLNEVCDRFAPEASGFARKGKVVFEGQRYVVSADMSAGYARIWDKVLKSYVLLDGTPCKSQDLTHFKIMRREEM